MGLTALFYTMQKYFLQSFTIKKLLLILVNFFSISKALFSPIKKHKTEEFFNIAATPEKCPAMRKMDFASPTKPAPIEETIVLASPPIRCIQSPDFKLFKRRCRPKFSKSCSFYGDQIDERSDCNTQSNTFFEACEAECFGDHNSNSTFSKRLNAIVFDEKNVENDEKYFYLLFV